MHDGEAEGMQGQFSEDEIQNLREIFELFDKERQGFINLKDLESIL